jgi:hypothetical protein
MNGSTSESGLNKLPEQGHQRPGGPLPELLEEVIVDQEATALEKKDHSEWGKRRRALSAFVDSVFFEYLTGIIILANIIMIGIEAEMSLTKKEEMSWATNVEQAFLAVYTLELLLRIAGVEWSSIREVPLGFLSGLIATSLQVRCWKGSKGLH